jgi:CubicO group peptidase (beta-lactamase class C family)
LAEATGQSVLDYARDRLFDPLGVKTKPALEVSLDELTGEHVTFQRNQFAWAADRQGIHTGCCGLKVTAPDLISIGELYLGQGNWQGSRIVSADWVRQSTTPHVTADQLAPDGGYGHLWWLAEQRGHRSFAAQGAFGQLILVVPDHKLVMAVTSRDDEAGDIDLQPLIDIVVSALE